MQGEEEAAAPHLPGAKPPGSHDHGGIGFSGPGYGEDGAAGAGAQPQTYTFHPPPHAAGYGAHPGGPPPGGPPPRGPARPGGPFQGQPPLPQGPPPGGPPPAQGYGPYGPPPGGMMNVNMPGFGGPMAGGGMMGGGYGPQGQMGRGFWERWPGLRAPHGRAWARWRHAAAGALLRACWVAGSLRGISVLRVACCEDDHRCACQGGSSGKAWSCWEQALSDSASL